jgi:outer membrane protein
MNNFISIKKKGFPKKYIFLFISFLIITFSGHAQGVLKIDEVIDKALESNFGIKISKKQIEAAENRIFKSNAGMVPIIDWNTGFNSTFNQVNQNFVDGRVINRFGQSYTPNTNLALSWTIYDGRRMYVIYDRLKAQGQQSQIQSKVVIQNTLSNVMQSFYDVQRLQRTVQFLKTIIKYYDERLSITDERWQIGRGSKLDYLQSKTDLTTQTANLINAESQLKSSKIRLNSLLARDAGTEFTVNEDLELNPNYNLDELLQRAKTQNQELLLINKSAEINLLNEKEAESFRLPRILLNSSFGYSFNTNNAGLITLNQQVGLNTGITMAWTIFDGQRIKRNIQLTKINTEIIQQQKEDLLNQISADLNSSYNQYQTDKSLLSLEMENKELAEENLKISLEKFKLGASTILELSDAQSRFDTALNRLVIAQYNVKISELNLLRISGELVK